MHLDEIVTPRSEPADPKLAAGPTVIEVRDLSKTFEIPLQRIDSIKERALHPFQGAETKRLEALSGISFDVHRGEFFGIVGRTGPASRPC